MRNIPLTLRGGDPIWIITVYWHCTKFDVINSSKHYNIKNKRFRVINQLRSIALLNGKFTNVSYYNLIESHYADKRRWKKEATIQRLKADRNAKVVKPVIKRRVGYDNFDDEEAQTRKKNDRNECGWSVMLTCNWGKKCPEIDRNSHQGFIQSLTFCMSCTGVEVRSTVSMCLRTYINDFNHYLSKWKCDIYSCRYTLFQPNFQTLSTIFIKVISTVADKWIKNKTKNPIYVSFFS